MSGYMLILRYSAFAIVATMLNLGVQRVILMNGTTSTGLIFAI